MGALSESVNLLTEDKTKMVSRLNLREELRSTVEISDNHGDSDSGRGPTSGSSSSGSDNDEQNECFVDASEVPLTDSSCQPNGLDGRQTEATEQAFGAENNEERQKIKQNNDEELSKCLGETAHILRLALSNEFVRALGMCEQRASIELYSGLAHATLCFLRASLTLERADLQAAQTSVQNSMDLSNRMRHQVSTASMLARFLSPYGSRMSSYDSHSDLEIHAELVNAESQLLHTLISFLADQSVICLVKSAFRIRSCHQRYKDCLQILNNRSQWGSPEAQRHFESGVRMGNGIFNLLMSYLPRRVLRFLEYVGFSGSRSTGIGELERSIELDDGLRSVLSALVILTYHSYVENMFGLGLYDEQKVRYLNDRFLSTYRNSAFFLLFQGRYHQMTGDLNKALDSFQKCIDAQDDWKQFHSICHWEMMWCHAVQLDWLSAAKCANLLRAHSKWSPASYTYQYASFLYEKLLQDKQEGRVTEQEYERKMAEVCELMQSVPSLRIRYAGKTIPADKFAIERSMKFCSQNNRLTMPALEFVYIWNIFCILRSNQKQVQKILAFVEQQQARLEAAEQSTCRRENIDGDLCLIYLLRGMCQKHLGQAGEAEKLFETVIEKREHVMQKQEKFLVPHAAMELVLLKLDARQYEESRALIKSTRSDYTGYLLETIVHFRLHAASRQIRLAVASQASDNQSENSLSCCPSPTSRSNQNEYQN